jgi:GDP-4-dehydro-6-deoxy-D-mannose reductase
MRVLVTGAAGFVGSHAMAELRKAGHSAIATVLPGQSTNLSGSDLTEAIDLLDEPGMTGFIARHQPDACIHLAGIAFVPAAWEHPQTAFQVNVIGTINLLEAFRKNAPKAKVLCVTSSQVYGHQLRTAPIRESDPPLLESLYALTKWSADVATLMYAQRYGMHTMTARPCNHIGPGQSENFVVSAFARQLIGIAAGRQPNVMQVGNLASEREFTDVRDTVRAYRLLLEKGHAGQAYNVATGKMTTIQALFDQLCTIVGVKPELTIDPKLYRPTDSQPLIDTSQIFTHTGWKPEIEMAATLRDVVDDFRRRVTAT